MKILPEKAVEAKEYKVFLSLIDMLKAFGIVNRKKHFENLEQFLEPDKPHMLNIITSFTQVKVKISDAIGKTFITIIGIIPLGLFKCTNLYFALSSMLVGEIIIYTNLSS